MLSNDIERKRVPNVYDCITDEEKAGMKYCLVSKGDYPVTGQQLGGFLSIKHFQE